MNYDKNINEFTKSYNIVESWGLDIPDEFKIICADILCQGEEETERLKEYCLSAYKGSKGTFDDLSITLGPNSAWMELAHVFKHAYLNEYAQDIINKKRDKNIDDLLNDQ